MARAPLPPWQPARSAASRGEPAVPAAAPHGPDRRSDAVKCVMRRAPDRQYPSSVPAAVRALVTCVTRRARGLHGTPRDCSPPAMELERVHLTTHWPRGRPQCAPGERLSMSCNVMPPTADPDGWATFTWWESGQCQRGRPDGRPQCVRGERLSTQNPTTFTGWEPGRCPGAGKPRQARPAPTRGSGRRPPADAVCRSGVAPVGTQMTICGEISAGRGSTLRMNCLIISSGARGRSRWPGRGPRPVPHPWAPNRRPRPSAAPRSRRATPIPKPGPDTEDPNR